MTRVQSHTLAHVKMYSETLKSKHLSAIWQDQRHACILFMCISHEPLSANPEEVSRSVTVSYKMTLLSLLYGSLCNLACTYTWLSAKRWHAKMCHSILLSSKARSEIGAFLTHVDSAHSTDTSLCLNNSCSCIVPCRTRSVNRSFWEWKCERVKAFADSYQNKHASNYIYNRCSAGSNLGTLCLLDGVFCGCMCHAICLSRPPVLFIQIQCWRHHLE